MAIIQDTAILSWRRARRRPGMMALLGLTITVLSAVVAMAWSAADGWRQQPMRNANRIRLSPKRGADSLTYARLLELSQEINTHGQLPEVRVVPWLTTAIYIETLSGRFKPVLCSSFAPNEQCLADVPVLEGDLPADPAEPTLILAPNVLQRLGYPARGMASRQVRVRAFRTASDEKRWCVFPCRIAAIVGDLGDDGVRMNLAALARVVLYQSHRIERIPGAADCGVEDNGSPTERNLSRIHACNEAGPLETADGKEVREASNALEGDEIGRLIAQHGNAAAHGSTADAADSEWADQEDEPDRHQDVVRSETSREQESLEGGNAAAAADDLLVPSKGSTHRQTASEPLDLASPVARLEEVHAFNLYVSDPVPAKMRRLHGFLESLGDFMVDSSFYKRGRQLTLVIAAAKMATPVIAVLVGTAVWAIVSLMGSAVASETPVICLWRSAGAPPYQIFLVYLLQTLWVGTAGAFFGTLTAVLLIRGPGQELAAQLEMQLFGGVPVGRTLLAVTGLTIASGTIPALRAARSDIEKGLRESNAVG